MMILAAWQTEFFFLPSHVCTCILTVQHGCLPLFQIYMLEEEVEDFCLNKETNNKSLALGPMA